ncbi:MAG: hypothetical protein K8L99_10605 [Anaerolineae bacterium]|nr:hypothetical protein [Anaerolineae bacterium]
MIFRRGLIILLALLLSTLSVSAQRAGQRPAPSGSGGSIGGPGLSGSALNAGLPDGSPGANTTRPDRGNRPDANTPRAGGARGGGFSAPSDLGDRFGGRDSFSLPLDSPGEFSFFQNFDRSFDFQNLENRPWTLPDFSASAPAAFEDIQAAIEAARGENLEQAQATYNQLWEDYYAAVDTTAQTYYDTVTATADYMLQSYQQAVDYTTEAVDYYLDYAQQYAAYCASFPWDCYSYIYDAASDTYTYVGDSSVDASVMVEIGTINAQVGYPVEAAPQPSAEAYEAIVIFANDQLGAVIQPLYAGVATGDVETLMSYLPEEIQAYLLNATTISGVAYWGLLNGGVAGVAVGDCTSANCTVSGDNLTFQISSASAGAYGLFASGAVPADANAALGLVTQVYPKLSGLSFAQVSDVEQGYAFTASAAGLGLDPATNAPLSVAKVVYAGVVAIDGKPFVYALVGVGQGYADLFS